MLGFSSSSSIFSTNVATTITSDMPVNFQLVSLLKLRIDDIYNQYRIQQIDIPFSIPIDVEYSRFQIYQKQDFIDNIAQKTDNQQ